MADIVRIGLELDVTKFNQHGVEAEKTLAKLKSGSKLTADELKILQSVLGQTGTAGQQAVVGVTQLGAAFNRTQTQARATSAMFMQLRGSVASMAIAATGQAVPGLATLTSALGTFALGAPLTVGVVAGIGAMALAWNHFSKEARDAKKASDEAIAASKEIGQTRASRLRGQQFDIGVRIGDIDAALADPGLRTRGQLRKMVDERREAVAAMARIEAEIQRLHKETQDDAAKEAKRSAKEAEQAWIDAAEAAARKWQRFHQELKQTPQELMRLMRTVGETAASFGQSTATTVGINPALRERIGAAFGAANAGMMTGVAGGNTATTGGFSLSQFINPMGLATNAVSSVLGKLTGEITGFVDNLINGAERAKEARRQWEIALQEVLAGISGRDLSGVSQVRALGEQAGIRFGAGVDTLPKLRAEIDRVIAALAGLPLDVSTRRLEELKTVIDALEVATEKANERMRDDLNLRLLQAQGMDKEALALRQQLEVQQMIAQGADEATLALLALVQGLERLNAEAEERKAAEDKARRIREAGEDLQVRLLRAQGLNQEAEDLRFLLDQQREYQQAVKDGLDEATLAALKLVQAAEAAARAAEVAREASEAQEDLQVRLLRAQGKDQEADILSFELRQQREREEAVRAGRSQEFLDTLAQIHKLEKDSFLSGLQGLLGGAGAGAGSRVQDEIIRSITGIGETTALTLVHIERSQLSVLHAIELNTRGNRSLTSTSGSKINLQVTFNGPVSTGNTNDFALQLAKRVNEELAHLGEGEALLQGNTAV